MSSLYHRRLREHPAAAFGLGTAILLGVCGPISVAAAQTGTDQRQKLEHLRDVNADARRNAGELRHQVDELQADAIDRGLLLTLDDALFDTNAVSLSRTGHRRLNALAAFLEQHSDRAVAIDGYAGAPGFRYDQSLSKRRADAVKAYLIQHGIAPRRLTARGNGGALPYNDSAIPQQPQRRVEVIIEDPVASVAQPAVTGPES